MPVPDEIRDVEEEIDAEVASLPLWKHGRAPVLEGLMGTYKDGIELTFVKALKAEVLGSTVDLQSAMVQEHQLRNGAFWAMKWATKFCPEVGRDDPISPKDVLDAMTVGQTYDVLVDVLKYGERDWVTLSINRDLREIVCFEGENVTGYDAEIVEHQQVVGARHVHMSLTADGDQLTSRWCAGDYRRVVRQLAEVAHRQEGQIAVRREFATTLDGEDISVAQPTLVWLNRPSNLPDCHAFDSLTMPRTMSRAFMWGARALLETPIANCAGRFCALSSDLKATAWVDDYMLRLAAREDEEQYNQVSGLREDRMISACLKAFAESEGGWRVDSSVALTNPTQEADIVATRSADTLVIELKSTLRPETVWEVYKRNQDILKGLCQAESLVRRGVGDRGLVITDGYRGDYMCWKDALRRDVAIGTLGELKDLARDPNRAFRRMMTKAGVPVGEHGGRRLPDRDADICGWTLRLVDATGDPSPEC